MKTESLASEDAPSVIVNRNIADLPVSTANRMPTKESLAKTCQRTRAANQADEATTTTIRGEPFLVYQDDNLAIFSTASNLAALCKFKHWMADGTSQCTTGRSL